MTRVVMARRSSLERRERQHEWMDEPGADPVELEKSLRYIRAINRWLGYTHATISHFERFSRSWERGRTVTVLDVATGSGDVPAELVRWGERKGVDVRVVGVDLHEGVIRTAAREEGGEKIRFVRGDATRLPFGDGSFDYAMTSMFLHHLDDEVVAGVFREMDRVARRGVVAADLVRDARAVFWIRVFSFWANPMVRHDAVVSVRQAFREGEIVELARQGGVGYGRYFRHFGHRFVLAGEKGG